MAAAASSRSGAVAGSCRDDSPGQTAATLSALHGEARARPEHPWGAMAALLCAVLL